MHVYGRLCGGSLLCVSVEMKACVGPCGRAMLRPGRQKGHIYMANTEQMQPNLSDDKLMMLLRDRTTDESHCCLNLFRNEHGLPHLIICRKKEKQKQVKK